MSSKTFVSLGIVAASLALAYVPLPGVNRTVVVVSGSELQEPLQELEERFESQNPNITIELKFQGSQDIVNNFIDDKNDFDPTVLVPATAEVLTDLQQRWQAQNGTEPFYEAPRAIAKTFLVGVAWPERGQALFPEGKFAWDRLENAMAQKNWKAIGGKQEWGSFDFVTTDPTRSNSGQLTLTLWAQAKTGSNSVAPDLFANPAVESVFALAKQSIYQPPRSTDILLEEFIARGPNDADAATVYESIALHRWQQANANQGKPYRIYYLDPTIETVSTAAIVKRDVSAGEAEAARQFLDFLTAPEQQQTFVRYGFRPAIGNIDLQAVPGSPWSQSIPGAEVDPPAANDAPDDRTIGEIQRLWQRSQ